MKAVVYFSGPILSLYRKIAGFATATVLKIIMKYSIAMNWREYSDLIKWPFRHRVYSVNSP